MSAIRIAIIGAGRWGPNHVRNFDGLEGCSVAAVADPSAAGLARIQKQFPGVVCRSSHLEVLEKDNVDAVVVATPTSTHYEVVRDCLAAGKHVLCEKPLADTGPRSWELRSLAKEKGRVLMVGHVFLFNPGIEYLVNHVRSRADGKTFYIHSTRTNLGPFRKDVNAAWDLASHDLYILNAMTDSRPEEVSVTGGCFLQRGVEDIAFMTLFYPDGVIGNVHVSWIDPRKIRQITVVSETKMVTWDEFGSPGPIMIHDRSAQWDPHYNTFGEFQLLAREGDIVVPRINMKEPLAQQAREFLARCNGAQINPGARGTPEEGAAVVNILEAATESLREKKSIRVRYGT